MKRLTHATALLLGLVMLISLAQDVSAERYDVYILTGQSNSLGTTRYDGDDAASYGPGTSPIDKQVSLYWSNVHASNSAYPPKLYGDSDGKIVPLQMQQGDGGNNPAFWGPEFGFARTIAAGSKNKVLIIKASRGGGGNGYWDKAAFDKDNNAGHMWQHLCETVDSALKELQKRGDHFDIKALLYLQGESNRPGESDAADKQLENLHANLRDHLNQQQVGLADGMKLVIGEIAGSQANATRKTTTQRQHSLAQSDAGIAFVQARDLSLQPDRIHFGKKAKLQIGRRMARAYDGLELIAQQHQLAQQAQEKLSAWRTAGDGDVKGTRSLIITLFTGNDTEPAPKYRERLTRTMKHIQAFYAKEMDRHGFGPLTFPLTLLDDGLLEIHVVKGDKPNAEYNGKDGQAIRKMVLEDLREKGIDASKETLVIFCNLTKWDPVTRRMSHHSPYYAGGSHQAGTAWQLDSALLDIGELANTNQELFLHDGQYGHISLGRYQSIFVGGVCHELGHALGLPHNKQRPDEQALWGTALMGSGNFTYGQEVREEGKGSFLSLAHALKLASHPAFSGSVKQMRSHPKSRYTELSATAINDGRTVRVAGRIEGAIPVYAVIAYLDPEGGRDYNATTHVAVPDDQGNFVIDCTAFAGKTGRLRLVRIHANGWARFAEDIGVDYQRDDQGRITVGPVELKKQRAAVDGTTLAPSAVSCPHCLKRSEKTSQD